LIFRDLLAHDEDVRIAAHFFGHGVAQRVADGHGHHFGALGHFRILRGGDRRSGGSGRRRGRLRFRGGGRRFGLRLRRRGGRLGRVGGGFAVGEDGGDRRVHRDVGGALR